MRQAVAALAVLGSLLGIGSIGTRPASAAPGTPRSMAAQTAQAPASQAAPAPGAQAAIEPPPNMTTYYMVFLRRSPQWTPEGPGVKELIEAHLANIRRLAQEGKLLLAGPFLEQTGPGSLAGLFVLQAGSTAEAREIAGTDPAVKGGRFTIEVLPWLGPKALAKVLAGEQAP
jgi:uncharacterized protein